MRLLPLKSTILLSLVLAYWQTYAQPQDPEARFTRLEAVSNQLSRQLMLQQLYVEEKTRSEGDSGIKQVRLRQDGTKPYHTATHTTANSIAAIHDHTDLARTVGMGELIAVLNGVEFRTRHNDYKLVRPSTTSGDYHATEPIPFPEVPPEVLQRTTVDGQIQEMREWFKAWRDQNYKERDYRPYFKPILCYLEGAWTNDVKLDEPFDSDRHHIDAASWFDLQEKVRFTSYTGDKSNQENFAYLPTTIMNVTDGIPVFGQWNYRILCHPIQGQLKLSELKPVENLGNRIAKEETYEAYQKTRAARFTLNPLREDQFYRWTRLDEIMAQIPGKDNYRANISDTSFGLDKINFNNDAPLNSGFYHRWFRVAQKGAMGEKTVHRGFADKHLFVAQTTQPRIVPMTSESCKRIRDQNGRRRKVCEEITARVSYAIPLEVIWLTPLQSWNPYELEIKSGAAARTVKANGRNGGRSVEKAYNGTSGSAYYLTPVEFFNGYEVGKDTADTTRGSVGVLDRAGNVRFVKASGVRIFLPNIPGVGVLRTRYPVMPVHAEGSPIWKELEALRDMVMDVKKYMDYFENPPAVAASSSTSTNSQTKPAQQFVHVLETSESNPDPVGLHTHTVDLARWQYIALTRRNKTLTVKTSEDNQHSHELQIRYDTPTKTFRIVRCDKRPNCFDGHSNELTTQTNA